MNMFTNRNKIQFSNNNFELYVDASREAISSNEKMLKETFSKISSFYYYLKFEDIVAHIGEVLPEFWQKNTDLYFLMLKFHLFELVKSNRKDEAFALYYSSVLPKINQMNQDLRERKNTIFTYILNRTDLVRSNFYINKAEFYFQLFFEKFKLEASNYYLGMENFFYQIKLKEIETRILCIEDFEDGLYLNAIELAQNFGVNDEFSQENEYFNVFDDQKEENIIAALPPNPRETSNKILSQPSKLVKCIAAPMFNNDMDLDNCESKNDYEESEVQSKSAPYQIFEVIKQSKDSKTPQINYKEKIKIPYLKKFNPKSLKREEIDKKIIRKFKKHLKELLKNKVINENLSNFSFWKEFCNKNLLPPMVYIQGDEKIEFKSFNSNFIVWLFSQNDAGVLYQKFIEHKRDEVFESIKQMIKVSITDEIVIELTGVYEYLTKFSEIYNVFNLDVTSSITKILKSLETPAAASTNIEQEQFFKGDEQEPIEAPVFDTDIFSHVAFTDEKNFHEDNSNFQSIDFFKNMGDSGLGFAAADNNEYNPFENYEYSDDDLGKMMNNGYSRRGSYAYA